MSTSAKGTDMDKCNVCGNAADLEIDLNTTGRGEAVWYSVCFDCEEKYIDYVENTGDFGTYQCAPKEF